MAGPEAICATQEETLVHTVASRGMPVSLHPASALLPPWCDHGIVLVRGCSDTSRLPQRQRREARLGSASTSETQRRQQPRGCCSSVPRGGGVRDANDSRTTADPAGANVLQHFTDVPAWTRGRDIYEHRPESQIDMGHAKAVPNRGNGDCLVHCFLQITGRQKLSTMQPPSEVAAEARGLLVDSAASLLTDGECPSLHALRVADLSELTIADDVSFQRAKFLGSRRGTE